MILRNLFESSEMRYRQVPRSVHGLRWQSRNDLSDAGWCCGWCRNHVLHMGHEALAVIEATHRIETGWLQAISLTANVVRDDHARHAGVSLVESTLGAEVLDRLPEWPFHVLVPTIELGKEHAASALVFHLHQHILQGAAVLVLSGSEAMRKLVYKSHNVLES